MNRKVIFFAAAENLKAHQEKGGNWRNGDNDMLFYVVYPPFAS
jgi:hypothetical protein